MFRYACTVNRLTHEGSSGPKALEGFKPLRSLITPSLETAISFMKGACYLSWHVKWWFQLSRKPCASPCTFKPAVSTAYHWLGSIKKPFIPYTNCTRFNVAETTTYRLQKYYIWGDFGDFSGDFGDSGDFSKSSHRYMKGFLCLLNADIIWGRNKRKRIKQTGR